MTFGDARAFFQAILFQDLIWLHRKAQGNVAQGLAFLDDMLFGFPVAVAELPQIHHVAAVEDHLVWTIQQVVFAEAFEFDIEVIDLKSIIFPEYIKTFVINNSKVELSKLALEEQAFAIR